jgi:hypothetical protein
VHASTAAGVRQGASACQHSSRGQAGCKCMPAQQPGSGRVAVHVSTAAGVRQGTAGCAAGALLKAGCGYSKI